MQGPGPRASNRTHSGPHARPAPVEREQAGAILSRKRAPQLLRIERDGAFAGLVGGSPGKQARPAKPGAELRELELDGRTRAQVTSKVRTAGTPASADLGTGVVSEQRCGYAYPGAGRRGPGGPFPCTTGTPPRLQGQCCCSLTGRRSLPACQGPSLRRTAAAGTQAEHPARGRRERGAKGRRRDAAAAAPGLAARPAAARAAGPHGAAPADDPAPRPVRAHRAGRAGARDGRLRGPGQARGRQRDRRARQRRAPGGALPPPRLRCAGRARALPAPPGSGCRSGGADGPQGPRGCARRAGRGWC